MALNYNISAIADNQQTVYVRWGMGVTDSTYTYCGWNIDDITFTGVDEFTLIVNVIGSGTVTKDPDQPTYTYGEVVTLSAFGEPGWRFDHWSGDLTGSNNPEQIVMDSDKTVTAHFVQEPPPDCPEDLYVDGVINLSDLGVLLGAYGSTPGDPNWNPYADFDGSDEIDLADLGTLLAVYGQDCPTP